MLFDNDCYLILIVIWLPMVLITMGSLSDYIWYEVICNCLLVDIWYQVDCGLYLIVIWY